MADNAVGTWNKSEDTREGWRRMIMIHDSWFMIMIMMMMMMMVPKCVALTVSALRQNIVYICWLLGFRMGPILIYTKNRVIRLSKGQLRGRIGSNKQPQRVINLLLQSLGLCQKYHTSICLPSQTWNLLKSILAPDVASSWHKSGAMSFQAPTSTKDFPFSSCHRSIVPSPNDHLQNSQLAVPRSQLPAPWDCTVMAMPVRRA